MSEDNGHKDDQIRCSFCGKSQSEVKKLVAGRGVYICDECIDVCISIVHEEKYEKEKELKSDLYKRLCDLLLYMNKNIERFPKFKAFLWTLTSRNIIAKEYNIETNEQLEEQAKLVNAFLKLAYWY